MLMEDTKKCSKCDAEMQKGRLLHNGLVWTGNPYDEVYENVVKNMKSNPSYGVLAYRCPSCNLVELYTAENEQALVNNQ